MPAVAPSPYSMEVAHGIAGDQWIEFNDFTGFIPGQRMWLSTYYKAVRVSGTATATLRSEVEWWNSSDVQLASTTSDQVIDASVPWTFLESPHTAPAGATRCRVKFTVLAPTGGVHLHDTYITAIRFAKTQSGATSGSTWGVDVSGIPIELTDGRVGNGLTSGGDVKRDIPGTVNVGGVRGSTIAGAANSFNSRLDRSASPLLAVADNPSIAATPNPDGTVDLEVSWDWHGDESTIDGFLVTYRQGDLNGGRVGPETGGAEFFTNMAPRQG